jgi:hypothetical protein
MVDFESQESEGFEAQYPEACVASKYQLAKANPFQFGNCGREASTQLKGSCITTILDICYNSFSYLTVWGTS